MFQVYEYLSQFFSQQPVFDEDGFAHFLLEEIDGELDVDITPITHWNDDLLKNKLLLDCDWANTFALSWLQDGKERLQVQHLHIREVKFFHETYELTNGNHQDEAALLFYSDELPGRVLRVQLLPNLRVQLVIEFA
jgi:hypothetical protein